MKKCRAMRLASAMLVLTLLSTCMISGTFAKYVTSDTASDTARVAKWGVTVTASGSLFEKTYKNEPETEPTQITVETFDTSDVVAPGTQNTTGLTLKVTGTPEVQNQITVSTTTALKDVFLAPGTYGVMVPATGVTASNIGTGGYYSETSTDIFAADTTYDPAETYYELHDLTTLGSAYYPITWTLIPNGGPDVECANAAALYAAVETAFNGINEENDAISKDYTITWTWPFDTNNEADTILGNIAADATVVKENSGSYTSALLEGTDYSTSVAFGVTIAATQVD